MKFDVFFHKFYSYYDIEAESKDEALEIAEGYFRETMCSPIADPTYDEVEIEVSEN
jgi:hypothetical protein